MFNNYLKIAIRNILKHKGYSFMNIFGLSIGMVSFLFILLFLKYELSYDSFHENGDSIYRVYQGDGDNSFAGTPYPLTPVLTTDIPGIVDFVRIIKAVRTEKVKISYEQNNFFEDKIYAVDPSLLTVFSFPLTKGDPQTALNSRQSIVVSESFAEKCFGAEDPIGKTLTIASLIDFTVTGVARDVPRNSHFIFDILIHVDNASKFHVQEYNDDNWGASNFRAYIRLADNADPDEVGAKIAALKDNYPNRDPEFFDNLHLQPLSQIHHSRVRGEYGQPFDIKYIYLFSAVAIAIIIIACINFMNLATARSASRAKEVGLRKVVGARRIQLTKQFLGESVMISSISAIFAFVFLALAVPIFNIAFESAVVVPFTDAGLLLTVAGLAIFVGLLSGSYPAFMISSYQPVKVIKGGLLSDKNRSPLRTILVVFQFSISIVLIISSLIIIDQLQFLKNKDLGWNGDQVVNIRLYDADIISKTELIKNELLKSPDVQSVSASDFMLSKGSNHHGIWWEGSRENEDKSMDILFVDHDFINTFQIELTQGRDFSKDSPNDTRGAYILNEAAVKDLRWGAPVGKMFSAMGGESSKKPVIGVVKDFHMRSLHTPVGPTVLYLSPALYDYLSVKINSQNIPATLDYIENTWYQFAAGGSFEYFFMDEDFELMYRSEETMGRFVGFITILAIVIACLGLLGLSSFMTEQRKKEIGIRKVLGASVPGIAVLMSKEFVKWVLLANLFAFPIAYLVMSRWLQSFAYQVGITWNVFALSGLMAFLIALLTVSYQSVKAAMSNPIDSLKYE